MQTLQRALPGGLTGTGSSDSRIIAAMRLVLAASGLLILGLHTDRAMLQLAPSTVLPGSYTLYSAALYLSIRQQHARAETLPHELARRLLDVPAEQVANFGGQGRRWLPQPDYQAYDPRNGAPELASAEQAGALAAMLDARSFITVPFQQQEGSGRLSLAAQRPAAFDAHDAQLLLQVIAQGTPVLCNIRLVDRLASDAAMYGATLRPFMRQWSLRVRAVSSASALATPTRLPRQCRASRSARSASAPAPWADALLSSTTIDTPPLSSKFRYSARRALR